MDFAWELVTRQFGLDPDRLFVTIHLDDDEAYGIWRDRVGVPEDRIYRYGDKDNWWGPAGTEGPTGPCFRNPLRRRRRERLRSDGGGRRSHCPASGRNGTARRPGQSPVAIPTATASVSWSFGTWFSCSSTRTRSGTARPCPPQALTRAWGWNGRRSSCRTRTTSTRPTCSSPSSPGSRSCQAGLTARTRTPTSPCGWWRNMPAPRRS